MTTTFTTTGVDPVAAGAVAQHQSVPHVDPYAAAKELRALAKEGMSLQPGLVETPSFGGAMYPLEEARMHLSDAYNYKTRVDEYLSFFDELLSQLDAAIKTRRVSECEPKMQAVRSQIAHIKSRHQRLGASLQAAVTDAKTVRDQLSAVSQTTPQQVTPAITRMREILDRVHILSQSIPTVPNMPLADQASQALRAVAAILRANGFVDSSVPAQDSYAVAEEDPDHEIEVEEEAGDGDPWE